MRPYFHTPPRTGLDLGDLLDDAVDVSTSAIDLVPGGGWAVQAIKDGTATLGDVARFKFLSLDVGFQILSVIAGGMSVGLSPILGPWIVNVAIATPGLLAGDTFTTAYTRGLTDYLEKAAFVFGGAAGAATALGPVLGSIGGAASGGGSVVALFENPRFRAFIDGAQKEIAKSGLTPKDAIEALGLQPEKVAADFNVRPDVAAIALNGALHAEVNDLSTFDPLTGQRSNGATRSIDELRRLIAAGRKQGANTSDLELRLIKAEREEKARAEADAAKHARTMALFRRRQLRRAASRGEYAVLLPSDVPFFALPSEAPPKPAATGSQIAERTISARNVTIVIAATVGTIVLIDLFTKKRRLP